jgi:60 kDa SS-A/Ro ribonucleoprotein
MAKYNTKREPTVKATVTHQGGVGFTQTPEKELIGILATGLDNTYYENENDRDKRFAEVFGKVAKKDKEFAAKSLVYARTKYGQRTVTHRGAVELIPFLQGDPLGKRFFSKRNRNRNEGGIVYRLDDMTEILACYLAKNGADAPIPNALKKGFKDAIEHMDAYQLAKYQMKNKAVSLVDIVNLVHPRETEVQGTVVVPLDVFKKAVKGTKFEKEVAWGTEAVSAEGVKVPALQALVLGVLKQFNTVEDKNTEAGKKVAEAVKAGELTQEEADVQLNEAKTENYKELIETKKIGYLALLRNVRNILKTGDTDLLNKACELLVEPTFIKKSLVWPHQIDLALEVMLVEFSGRQLQKVSEALGTAYERSIPNLKELLPEGRTAVVFDTSGSMEGGWSGKLNVGKTPINASPAQKAALVAATFAKGIGADVYHFANYAAEIKGWNPTDSVNTLKREFESHNGEVGHGTQFGSCFDLFARLNRTYDRVVIISDCQDGGWHGNSFEGQLKSYGSKFGTPYVYIIDITGYANVSGKPGSRVFRLQGYSQHIYEHMPKVEINPNIVIEEIRQINI